MIEPVHPKGLNDAILAKIETSVLDKAKAVMTARRFLDFEGPLGAGIESLQVGPVHDAESDGTGARVAARRAIPIPTLYSTFALPRREIEGAVHPGVPLDTGPAEDAAEEVALAEEHLLYHGIDNLHLEGIATHPSAQSVTLSDWSTAGVAIGDVIQAADMLDRERKHGPFALVLAPTLYNQLFRKYEGTDVLALDHLRRLATGGIYKCHVLSDSGVLVSPDIGPVVCAQDLQVSFLEVGPSTVRFTVSSAVVARIDDPAAACVLKR
ncbi:MAG TPA: family 1 encapsulin nanocompartment shell protein [Sandaracinaceae bacterium LLY-WYZ-13_1]|nr:family 1 encapsulin nanocompartment shell protein [Sandaracinaceae bacterium LLY-WYZ-13_1]